MVNTNLCTAVAMLVWIGWDLIYKDKPSLIGTVNGMITGLVGITPAAGYVNGYGAIVIGVVARRSSGCRSATSAACGRSARSTTRSG